MVSTDRPMNQVIVDEALVEGVEKEERISDDMMTAMNTAIGAPTPKLKYRKGLFTHAQISAKKRAAARKAERQNRKKGRK